MTREHSIPLFLWIATALVVHAIGGGGAHEVAQVLEEKLDIQKFAHAVRSQASRAGGPLQASWDEELSFDEFELEPTEIPEETAEEKLQEPEKEPEPEKLAQPEKKKPEPEKKKVDLLPTPTPPPPQPQPTPPPQGRIAVQQQVEDKEQEDNPDARFAAEHANRVDEETQARITNTEQDSPEPTPSGSFAGEDPEPGNSNEQRVAQNEESPGEEGRAPGSEAHSPSSSAEPTATASAAAPTPSSAPAPPAPPAREASRPSAPSPDSHSQQQGSWGLAPGQMGSPGQKKLPDPISTRPTDLFGLGATGRTKNGVNLNLTPQMAVQAVGADQLAMERRGVGQRRLSAHRGSWKSQGMDRWRSAIENYVATVKPGNQTALNTARVPFAKYLNEIHNRIHPLFADSFLSHLDSLPPSHPMNQSEMSTHVEIQLSGEDGRVLKLGITKSSGVTGFDIGALDSVQRAGPYGPPPAAILSSDGHVYLHWEFHRKPHFACSTYFARPFILNLPPQTAPPQVTPPAPHEEGKSPPARENSGSDASSAPVPRE